jgi:lysophospholipase L1-like esterase
MARSLPLLAFALLVALHPTPAHAQAASGDHLFILSGQSNMAKFDPSISFTPAVSQAFGADHVTVVKSAYSGQPIQRWDKGWEMQGTEKHQDAGDLYGELITAVQKASQGKNFKTVTFLWMQGESDATSNGDKYEASLRRVIAQLQDDLHRKDIQIVLGRLSDHGLQKKKGTKTPDWQKIRDIQEQVADTWPQGGAWVNTDDLNDGVNAEGKTVQNDLHYTVEGYKLFGDRLAEKAIALIQKAPPQPKK